MQSPARSSRRRPCGNQALCPHAQKSRLRRPPEAIPPHTSPSPRAWIHLQTPTPSRCRAWAKRLSWGQRQDAGARAPGRSSSNGWRRRREWPQCNGRAPIPATAKDTQPRIPTRCSTWNGTAWRPPLPRQRGHIFQTPYRARTATLQQRTPPAVQRPASPAKGPPASFPSPHAGWRLAGPVPPGPALLLFPLPFPSLSFYDFVLVHLLERTCIQASKRVYGNIIQ